jgi:hypothetical protein
VLISDDAIKRAMQLIHQHLDLIAEPSAANSFRTRPGIGLHSHNRRERNAGTTASVEHTNSMKRRSLSGLETLWRWVLATEPERIRMPERRDLRPQPGQLRA